MSSIINKVKDALHHDNSTTSNTTTTTTTHAPATAEGVHGPHSTRVGNAADPRVDSDLDGHVGQNHGVGHTHGAGTAGLTGAGTTGLTGAGTTGVAGAPGTGYGNTAGTGAGYGTTNTSTGPHSSGLANKMDPTVNSNSYGTGQTGTGVGNHALGGTGDRGGLSNSTNAGPHNANLANKLDPRVDSDLDSTGNRHGASKAGILGASGSHATAGSGTAQNTQGPHNSDTLNKLDPRVDADGDGSRTYGGNKTHS